MSNYNKYMFSDDAYAVDSDSDIPNISIPNFPAYNFHRQSTDDESITNPRTYCPYLIFASIVILFDMGSITLGILHLFDICYDNAIALRLSLWLIISSAVNILEMIILIVYIPFIVYYGLKLDNKGINICILLPGFVIFLISALGVFAMGILGVIEVVYQHKCYFTTPYMFWMCIVSNVICSICSAAFIYFVLR
jgi:hypothetical protein